MLKCYYYLLLSGKPDHPEKKTLLLWSLSRSGLLGFFFFFFLALSTIVWVTGSFSRSSESSVRQGWCGASFISMFHTVWEVPQWSVKTWALEAEVFVQYNSQLCYSPAVWSETSCWTSLSLCSLIYRQVRWHVLHELAYRHVWNSVGHVLGIQWKPLAFHCCFLFFSSPEHIDHYITKCVSRGGMQRLQEPLFT